MNNYVQNLGKILNIFIYFESQKILFLRIEVGGHLAPESLWILDDLISLGRVLRPFELRKARSADL